MLRKYFCWTFSKDVSSQGFSYLNLLNLFQAYSAKSSVLKSFLKNLSKINLNKAHNFVWTTIRTGGMSDRWNQNLRLMDRRGNLCRIFRLVDKWSVRQMKLFNLMNCRAIDTSGKLDVRKVA